MKCVFFVCNFFCSQSVLGEMSKHNTQVVQRNACWSSHKAYITVIQV